MLPVVSGIKITKINIFVYAVILFLISMTPYFFGYSGIIYLVSSISLGSYYVYICYKLLIEKDENEKIAKKIFLYSILYLFLIFTIILIDKIFII